MFGRRNDGWWVREIERLHREHWARERELMDAILRLAGAAPPPPMETLVLPDPDHGFLSAQDVLPQEWEEMPEMPDQAPWPAEGP